MFKGHQQRIIQIREQLLKENILDSQENKTVFIDKWVFVIPWTIENCSNLLPYALSLSENEQKTIGFQLAEWKSK